MRKTGRMGRVAALLCVGALLLSGCGITDATRNLKSLTEVGVDDGASEGLSDSVTVGPDKGAVLELATGAKLVVPERAVDAEIELSMTRPKDAEAVKLVKSVSSKDKVSSAPYVFTPHGTQFKKDVEVTLPVAKDRDSAKLVVAWLRDEKDTEWKTLGQPQVEGDKATIKVKHFSVLVLLERGDESIGGEIPGDEDEPGGDGDTAGDGDAEPVLKEGEFLYEHEVPIINGANTLRDWGKLVYDRGSVYWMSRTDDAMTLWRLRVEAGPGAPTQVITTPSPFDYAYYSGWDFVATQDHLVWGADTPGSVAKEGSGYREIAVAPPDTPMFAMGDKVVIAGGGPDYPWVLLSPSTGETTSLPSALTDLARSQCLYDATNDVVGCIVGHLTTDGMGGDGVETFDFKANERKSLGRANDLYLATYQHDTILQNATHWFTASAGTQPGIVVWPKDGGAYRVLEGFATAGFAYAVDDEALYVCRGVIGGSELVQVALSDFQEVPLSSGCYEVLGVDDQYIYFYERQGLTNTPNPRYLFKRLPKP